MAKKITTILFTLSILLIVLTAANCGNTPGLLPKIQQERVAYVGTVPFEPPLLFQREGEYVGPDAELGRRILEAIQAHPDSAASSVPIRLTWVPRQYTGLAEALANGELSFVLGVFAITEARKEIVDFSDPYYESEFVLVMNPVVRDVDPNNLAGVTVGVREGTGVETFVRESYAATTVRAFRTLDDAILALRSGDVDAVVDDRNLATYAVATIPGVGHLEVVPDVLGTIPCGVAVRKGDRPLVELINGVIDKLKAENLLVQWLESEWSPDDAQAVLDRRKERLEAEARKHRERQVSISIARAPNYDIDIYTLANVRFTFREQTSGRSFTTSPINFRGRVGYASAAVPPGNYVLSLGTGGFSTGVEISPNDDERVSIRITLNTGGVVEVTKS
jgi:glutamine transport system substrate-binding protein